MTFLQYLKNLFTGYRPYKFIPRHLRSGSQQQNYLFSQYKLDKNRKFMSKHRYLHTSKKKENGD